MRWIAAVIMWCVSISSAHAVASLRVLPSAPEPNASFLAFAGGVVYEARDAQFGLELWWTDGSVAGTRRLTDLGVGPGDGLCGGTFPAPLWVFQDRLYFYGRSGNQVDLWRTDAQGNAEPVRALGVPCPQAFPDFFSGHLRQATGDLFLMAPAVRPGSTALEPALWRIHLPTGHAEVAAFPTNDYRTLHVDSIWNDQVFVRLALTNNSVGPYAKLVEASHSFEIVVSSLYGARASGTFQGKRILGGAYMYISDGSLSGTAPLTSVGTIAVRPGIEWNGIYYLQAALGGGERELWRTDGTLAGTYVVHDFHMGWPGIIGDPVLLGDRLVFFRDNYGGTVPSIIFESDGTYEGTVPLRFADEGLTLYRNRTGGTADKYVLADTLYVVASDQGDQRPAALWAVDGATLRARRVSALMPGQGTVSEFAPVNGHFLLRHIASGVATLYSVAPSLFRDGLESPVPVSLP